MTRRSSLRAQAREIYRELVQERAKLAEAPSLTLLRKRGREQKQGGAEKSLPAQNLTEKVRALYEHSAVPVAEIAKLAGVSERTIYKYAAKGRWKPRYAFTFRRAGAAGGAPARGWRAGKRFAPAKGAGGRFIRRADKGKPFAAGLKATDPAAAADAGVACGEAARLARAAQRRVAAERREEARLRANETVNRAMADLNRYCAARAKAGQPGLRDDDRVAQLLVRTVEIATEHWQRLLAP